MAPTQAREISEGERFPFGANWAAFLSALNDERIREAEHSLKVMLDLNDLTAKRFLDIGSGSGLFSLAARRLGASVYSFDYDPLSVACTRELKKRYYPDDKNWSIDEASILDEEYVTSLGQFDVVYSWGVLHHTGNMTKALHNAMLPVSDQGLLFIAIYNDQDGLSDFWKQVKRMYCSSWFGRAVVTGIFVPLFALRSAAIGLARDTNPAAQFSSYRKKRGMSIYRDWVDWLGGYPFEVAKPEVILNLCKSYGYTLENLVTTNRLGCNQFVFRKVSASVFRTT